MIEVGDKFGKLVVVSQATSRTYQGSKRTRTYRAWSCHCDCGNTVDLEERQLRYEGTTECFSCAISGSKNAKFKHGATSGRREAPRQTPEYRAWQAMKRRCYNPNVHQYSDYGGRGIRVCERWLHSFENFLADMGPKPTPQHTIDRKDGDKDYTPGNCRWATDGEQRRNKRTTRYVTVGGIAKPLVDWLVEQNLPEPTWRYRKKHGWSDEDALLTPPHQPPISGVIGG